jgi:hypothetical protein
VSNRAEKYRKLPAISIMYGGLSGIRTHGTILVMLATQNWRASGRGLGFTDVFLIRNGCVCSHSARALTVGSIPAFSHHAASSPERWT